MSKCVGLGLLAVISLFILVVKIFLCFFVWPELKKYFCLDFHDSRGGYDVIGTLSAFLFLLYYLFFVLPDCL